MGDILSGGSSGGSGFRLGGGDKDFGLTTTPARTTSGRISSGGQSSINQLLISQLFNQQSEDLTQGAIQNQPLIDFLQSTGLAGMLPAFLENSDTELPLDELLQTNLSK